MGLADRGRGALRYGMLKQPSGAVPFHCAGGLYFVTLSQSAGEPFDIINITKDSIGIGESR